jgi:hypothetical protein
MASDSKDIRTASRSQDFKELNRTREISRCFRDGKLRRVWDGRRIDNDVRDNDVRHLH